MIFWRLSTISEIMTFDLHNLIFHPKIRHYFFLKKRPLKNYSQIVVVLSPVLPHSRPLSLRLSVSLSNFQLPLAQRFSLCLLVSHPMVIASYPHSQ